MSLSLLGHATKLSDEEGIQEASPEALPEELSLTFVLSNVIKSAVSRRYRKTSHGMQAEGKDVAMRPES